MARSLHILLCVSVLLLMVLLVACSKKSRYRVMTFFFDGVPPPVSAPIDRSEEESVAGTLEADATPDAEAVAVSAAILYPHPPYRNGKCGACHNPDDGQLFKTAQEGLCTPCHSAITQDRAFLHGPVAVKDCLFCHHAHASNHPKVLLYESNETCSQCHDEEDLTEGLHHEETDSRKCVNCHDPHGGPNRLFLLPDWQATP